MLIDINVLKSKKEKKKQLYNEQVRKCRKESMKI